MTDIDSILQRIRTGLAKHGRKTKVSQHTGIPVPRLCDAKKPDWNPTAETVRRIDAALNHLFPADRPHPPHQP